MNIKTAINKAKYLLEKKNIKTPGLDCELLMSKVLKKSRSYILLNLDKNLKKKNLDNFERLIHERSKGKPIAYLLEKKEFLIPALETQVAHLLELIQYLIKRN